MGGYLSATLSMLYSIFKENLNKKLWKDALEYSAWIRYRDDIIIFTRQNLRKEGIENTIKKLQRLYHRKLEIELEDVTHSKGTFLDFNIIKKMNNKETETWHYNKNYNIIHGKNKATTRLPDNDAIYEKKIFLHCCHPSK